MQALGIENPPPEDVYNYGLFLLDKILSDSGHTLTDFPSMPQPLCNWAALTLNPLILEQLNYNPDTEHAELNTRLPTLNDDQWAAYIQIIESIEQQDPKVFFLNGQGGSGKTYMYNTICAKLWSEGLIILCMSSSGISALLIRGGRTAHSVFKTPIDNLTEMSMCHISKNTPHTDLMCSVKAIIWDEVGAQHRYTVEAVDRTLWDICSDNWPFGGITVILFPCDRTCGYSKGWLMSNSSLNGF